MLPRQREGSVYQNNVIYKGYRLTAKVVREAPQSAAPVFSAVVTVAPASMPADDGDEYPVPQFVDGAVVYSPKEAVHAAVAHGREIVDALTGFPQP